MQVDLGSPKRVSHPSETENRLAYAQRIIVFLDARLPKAKAANLAVLDHASWNRIATLADEKHMPSKATIMAVIAMVRGRELAVEAIQASLSNTGDRLLSRLTTVDHEAELV